MAMASSISHDSSEKGNGDDEFVHVECKSEMFTMSSDDQYDESGLGQCDSDLPRDVSVSLRKIRIEL